MSKLNPTFVDLIEKDIAAAQKNAEVIPETAVVNFQPAWNDDVTKESLLKHVDWMNHQGAVVHAGTANIAYDQYPETKKKDWTGVMDLGCMQITAMTQLHDQVETGGGKSEDIFGQCDLFFDYKHSDDLSAWYESFMSVDEERCKALFEEK